MQWRMATGSELRPAASIVILSIRVLKKEKKVVEPRPGYAWARPG